MSSKKKNTTQLQFVLTALALLMSPAALAQDSSAAATSSSSSSSGSCSFTLTSPANGTNYVPDVPLGGACCLGSNIQISAEGRSQTVSCGNGGSELWNTGFVVSGHPTSITFTATQVDATTSAATAGPISVTLSAPPSLFTVTSPANNTAYFADIAFGGACNNGYNIAVNGQGRNQIVSCNNGSWNTGFVVSGTPASITFSVTEINASDNMPATLPVTITLNAPSPSFAVTTPANNAQYVPDVPIGGNCDANTLIDIAGQSRTQEVSCTNGIWNTGWVVSGHPASISFTATELDAATRATKAQSSFTLVAPANLFTVTSPANNTNYSADIPFGGACNNGYNIAVNGQSRNQIVSCNNGSWNTGFVVSGQPASIIFSITEINASDSMPATQPTTITLYAPGSTGTNSTSTSTGTSGWTKIDDSASGSGANQFNYSGNWVAETSSGDYQGGDHYNCTANQSFTLSFSGTQVIYDSVLSPYLGIAAVSIDGGSETMVDLSASAFQNSAPRWTSPQLSNGNHTLKVRTTGTAGAQSTSGSCTIADEVDVFNPPSPITEINDSTTGTGNNQFNYSGNWVAETYSGDYQGDDHYNCTTNDFFTFDFNGTQVLYSSPLSPFLGLAAVSIDGGSESMVDLSSLVEQNSAVRWISPVLSLGQHTLKVRRTGTKGAYSTNATCIVADAVGVIEGSQTPVSPPPSAPVNPSCSFTVTSPANNTDYSPDVPVGGACCPGNNIEISAEGRTQTVACGNGGSEMWNTGFVVTGHPTSIAFTVTQVDSTTSAVTGGPLNFTLNAPPLVFSVTSPANNTNYTADIPFGGACDTGYNIAVNGQGRNQIVSCGNGGSGKWNTGFVVSGAPSSITFSITEINASDNMPATLPVTITLNAPPPSFAVTTPANNAAYDPDIPIGGVCDSNTLIDVSAQGRVQEVSCNNGIWDTGWVVSGHPAAIGFVIAELDATTRVDQAQAQLTLVAPPNLFTVTSPANNTNYSADIAFGGACNNGYDIAVNGQGRNQIVSCGNGGSGKWNTGFVVSGHPSSLTFSITEINANDNMPATLPVTITLSAPAATFTVTSPANGSAYTADIPFGGACDSGTIVNVTGFGASQDVTCSGGAWNTGMWISGMPSAVQFQVTELNPSDRSLIAGPITITLPTSGLQFSVTSPSAGSNYASPTAFGGKCDGYTAVDLTGQGHTQEVSCANGSWSASFSPTGTPASISFMVTEVNPSNHKIIGAPVAFSLNAPSNSNPPTDPTTPTDPTLPTDPGDKSRPKAKTFSVDFPADGAEYTNAAFFQGHCDGASMIQATTRGKTVNARCSNGMWAMSFVPPGRLPLYRFVINQMTPVSTRINGRRVKTASTSRTLRNLPQTIENGDPIWPYIRIPALEMYNVRFKDNSTTRVLVIPDIAIPTILEMVYQHTISGMGFKAHVDTLTVAPKSPFAPCDPNTPGRWQQLYTGGLDPLSVPSGTLLNPPATRIREFNLYKLGYKADTLAWTEALKRTQDFIAKMKTSYGAMTYTEMKSLGGVINITDIGQWIPPTGGLHQNQWIAMWKDLNDGDIVPIIAYVTNHGASTEATHAYKAAYFVKFIRKITPYTFVRQKLFTYKAESIAAPNLAAWYKSLPIAGFNNWRSQWQYQYCMDGMTEPDQWLAPN